MSFGKDDLLRAFLRISEVSILVLMDVVREVRVDAVRDQ